MRPPEDTGDWLARTDERLDDHERLLRRPAGEERRNLSHLDEARFSYGALPTNRSVYTWLDDAPDAPGAVWVAPGEGSPPAVRVTVTGSGDATADLPIGLFVPPLTGDQVTAGGVLYDASGSMSYSVSGGPGIIPPSSGDPCGVRTTVSLRTGATAPYVSGAQMAGQAGGTPYLIETPGSTYDLVFYAPLWASDPLDFAGHTLLDPATDPTLTVSATRYGLDTANAPGTPTDAVTWTVELVLVPVGGYSGIESVSVTA